VEIPRTTTAFEIAIEDEGLPSEHVGKQIGWPEVFRGTGTGLVCGLIGAPTPG
jgi:hypothetical protein